MTLRVRESRVGGPRWLWALVAIGIAIIITSFLAKREKALPGSDNTSAPPLEPIAFQIVDRSQRDTLFLFSKTSSGDLWFRDERGKDHYVASNVVRASFSPDGTKFAYGNSSDELFIRSLAGKRLAELTRVRDHVWSSNSSAVTLSPVMTSDYPETEQTIIYILEPEQKRSRGKGE